jgi:hypothetical protein
MISKFICTNEKNIIYTKHLYNTLAPTVLVKISNIYKFVFIYSLYILQNIIMILTGYTEEYSGVN